MVNELIGIAGLRRSRVAIALGLDAGEKHCTKCNVIRPFDDFGPDNRASDGRQPSCTPCKRTARQALKSEVIGRYGGACKCCGVKYLRFLNIDHIDGGGAAHLEEVGPASFYPWLKKNGYPSGFQVLCFSCNIAKHTLGLDVDRLITQVSGWDMHHLISFAVDFHAHTGIESKECTTCHIVKPTDAFYSHPECKLGVNSRCKSCQARFVFGYKLECLDEYGRDCACCGESYPHFLSFDHILGGGATKSRHPLRNSLRKHGFPSGFRTLCNNCNSSAHWLGNDIKSLRADMAAHGWQPRPFYAKAI